MSTDKWVKAQVLSRTFIGEEGTHIFRGILRCEDGSTHPFTPWDLCRNGTFYHMVRAGATVYRRDRDGAISWGLPNE